ncbi:uncharacterized protein LOC115941600 isoform X2 [Leptonychotes weddellii]|uniref:Uncharacterized protein LOC115941600 isoform X2 n=1 Tax=Leptonychotes weddellii TaxID=9713 RepID=A0A7F8R0F4_LEPWE|nr:uncharacterized protein LOC115941600 isoform X2 [Leptonychotes weddellii]
MTLSACQGLHVGTKKMVHLDHRLSATPSMLLRGPHSSQEFLSSDPSTVQQRDPPAFVSSWPLCAEPTGCPAHRVRTLRRGRSAVGSRPTRLGEGARQSSERNSGAPGLVPHRRDRGKAREAS